jgi:GDP-L-fucose synthase
MNGGPSRRSEVGIAQSWKKENATAPTDHPMMDKSEKIFVAGHRGLVGSAMIRCLERDGFNNLSKRDRSELDLGDDGEVRNFFAQEKPAVVIFAAAKVGGIKANDDFPVEFLLDNLRIQNNVIQAAHKSGVRKLLFLGSSCIYPKFAPQPIPETALLSGPLEPTNEAYAIAKIAGIELCQAFSREYGANFISVMPTNLYGPNDNFDLETSHVFAALLRKAHEAKTRKERKLIVWGSGKPRREFLHVDDLASACLFLLEKYDSPEIINVGSGEDISIRDLAELISDVVGFDGEFAWDTTKPDGTPRKLLDITKLRNLGWQPSIPLRDGIAQTYDWFLKNVVR